MSASQKRSAALASRPVIDASWRRMRRIGVDPGQPAGSAPVDADDLERRRRVAAIAEVLPVLSQGLSSLADATTQIMVITDHEGRVLWRQGNTGVLRKADGICLMEGAGWGEDRTGTNAIGTAIAEDGAVQVHAREHYLQALTNWTCAAAPVHDPRDGRLLGIADLSGPQKTVHPTTLALVDSVTRLAETTLRLSHLSAIERLRSVAAPLLCRVGGRALAVDPHGWVAGVTGMAPFDRLPLPKGFGGGERWLPSLGVCSVEPLPGGWLLRLVGSARPGPSTPNQVLLDLSAPYHWTVTVEGATGRWTQDLTPRHAELLYVLAVHREGRTAAQLASDLFGDPSRTVTVRAEMSRVRRHLSGVLAHRPYRFREDVRVEVVRPRLPAALLPQSVAPLVRAGSEQED
ncbi:helix-turn-helix domain-containing protein [Streptomyces tsukubensis]|uniref:Diguanylate cyclase n=1 Tax=Streptomyces tsukubensis TaxID=83656 RepID=A0A1V4AB88_9ACTN|nr:helix-turn-helix domain-containing protein [Streptomyces tsukubensis]OON80623.1 diguanylate cyclase [Streptomyces tsukubensis]QFR96283.1 GAF domain-containing protein [Streptomyces tsukubensis]